MPPKVKEDECVGCVTCVEACPNSVLELTDDDKVKVANPDSCDNCWECVDSCPTEALEKVE